MLHRKFKKDHPEIKEGKNGKVRLSGNRFQIMEDWRFTNSRSQYLTACHENGCGRTVEFLKDDGKYFYHCLECGARSEVLESQGRAILSF